MTEKVPDQEFWDLADSFIKLANNHLDEADPDKVSSALLYAAARFNAFIVASAEDVVISEEKDAAVNYFSGQYRKMLAENLDDYEENPLSP